jgi:mannose-6-phosphate isomerase-like protein (cupin superfamily)
MSPVFQLNHEKLRSDARLSLVAKDLGKWTQIDSRETFNRYCQEACRIWSEEFKSRQMGQTSARFKELVEQVERGGPAIIRTPWGGVVVTKHEQPNVEKYLVIRKGGYLALETHEQKDERIEVREGAGLILWRQSHDQALMVQELAPGDRFHFGPGMEHCLIGTEDLLVFERSTDPKGMDQDLVFIYEPVAPNESSAVVSS